MRIATLAASSPSQLMWQRSSKSIGARTRVFFATRCPCRSCCSAFVFPNTTHSSDQGSCFMLIDSFGTCQRRYVLLAARTALTRSPCFVPPVELPQHERSMAMSLLCNDVVCNDEGRALCWQASIARYVGCIGCIGRACAHLHISVKSAGQAPQQSHGGETATSRPANARNDRTKSGDLEQLSVRVWSRRCSRRHASACATPVRRLAMQHAVLKLAICTSRSACFSLTSRVLHNRVDLCAHSAKAARIATALGDRGIRNPHARSTAGYTILTFACVGETRCC